MIEYQAPGSASVGFGSMVIDTNWDGAIGDMGQQGWELVTILQTPATTTQTVSVCENYQFDVDVFPAASG